MIENTTSKNEYTIPLQRFASIHQMKIQLNKMKKILFKAKKKINKLKPRIEILSFSHGNKTCITVFNENSFS